MNILRLEAYEDTLVIFTKRSIYLEKVTPGEVPYFQHIDRIDLEFTVYNIVPYRDKFLLNTRNIRYVFDIYTRTIQYLAKIPMSSWYGGADIEITRLGTVKTAGNRFLLPEMPSKVLFSRYCAFAQCNQEIIIISESGTAQCAGCLDQVNERFLVSCGAIYDHNGVKQEASSPVIGLTQQNAIFYPTPGVAEHKEHKFELGDGENISIEYAVELTNCFVCITSPADLFVDGVFVDQYFTTRPTRYEYDFPNDYKIVLTENYLAFTIKQLPAEFEFYTGEAYERDQYESWTFNGDCCLIKRYTTYQVMRGAQGYLQVAGFQVYRKECYGFIGDQAIFRADGYYYICQIQLLPNGFSVRNDYIINQELVFAKNDTFLPRIALKRSGDKYYAVLISELTKNSEITVYEACEIRGFHQNDTIYYLSSTVFVIMPIDKAQKLLFYQFVEKTVRLAENSFQCEACEFYRENYLFVLLEQQLSLLNFSDGDVYEHIFSNFQVQSIFRDYQANLVIGLVSAYGFAYKVCMKIKDVNHALFYSDRKCIISVPVSSNTTLHCNDNCFGYYMDGEYTIVPIVDYQNVFDYKQQINQQFGAKELERLLIRQPFLSDKFRIACTCHCCFCYANSSINIVECINQDGKAKLFLKQLRDDKLYYTGHIDVSATVTFISPNQNGVCILLENMQLYYYVFSREQLQFIKMCDLAYYGLYGSNFRGLVCKSKKVYVKCSIENVPVVIIVEDNGNIDCLLEDTDEAMDL